MNIGTLPGIVAVLLVAQDADSGPGVWDVLEQIDPITDTRTFTATLPSNTQPTIPLTVRCRIEPEGTPQLDLFMMWEGKNRDPGKILGLHLPHIAFLKTRLGKQKAVEDAWRAEPFRHKGRLMTGTFYISAPNSEDDSTQRFISAMGGHSIFAAQFDGADGEQVAVWDIEDMLPAIEPVLQYCPLDSAAAR